MEYSLDTLNDVVNLCLHDDDTARRIKNEVRQLSVGDSHTPFEVCPLDHLLSMLMEGVYHFSNDRSTLSSHREELDRLYTLYDVLHGAGHPIPYPKIRSMCDEFGVDSDTCEKLRKRLISEFGMKDQFQRMDHFVVAADKWAVLDMDFDSENTSIFTDEGSQCAVLILLDRITGGRYKLDEGRLFFKPTLYKGIESPDGQINIKSASGSTTVSYTHLRAHET